MLLLSVADGHVCSRCASSANIQLILQHSAGICRNTKLQMMGAKNKKSSFVPYEIDGDSGSAIFPLPAERAAVGMHKKHYPNGRPASMASKDKVADVLQSALPGIDLAWPGLRVLHLDPPVLVADNFFSEEECDAYAELRNSDSPDDVHELAQSATFSGATSQARTSTTWFVAYQRVTTLLAKASALLGVEDLSRFEEPQLVRYAPGQYFNWHYDAVPPTLLNNGGQRVATLLVYLNDVPEGGRTSFRDLRAGGTDEAGQPLRLMVAPKKGRAILFCPAAADGVPDDRTLHAGEPTAQGEDKWIAQVWRVRAAGNARPNAVAPTRAATRSGSSSPLRPCMLIRVLTPVRLRALSYGCMRHPTAPMCRKDRARQRRLPPCKRTRRSTGSRRRLARCDHDWVHDHVKLRPSGGELGELQLTTCTAI